MQDRKDNSALKDERPSEYCRRMQEKALDAGDTASAMNYYEMAKMWIERGM